ncbi:hypothetical protein [Kitasatospora sp. NPDC101183]
MRISLLIALVTSTGFAPAPAPAGLAVDAGAAAEVGLAGGADLDG